MILLDTNVISELVRRAPDPAVLLFVRSFDADIAFTAAICEAEIRYGLARLPIGKRRDDLTGRIDALFAQGLQDQILPFDSVCAAAYGEIRADREACGRPIEVEDAMIAATARAHGATLATRNARHFEACGIPLVDPWLAS